MPTADAGLRFPFTAMQKEKRGTVDNKQRGIRQVTAVKDDAISAEMINMKKRTTVE